MKARGDGYNDLSEGIYERGIRYGEKRGETRGRFNMLLDNVRSLMENIKCTKEKAMDILNVPLNQRDNISEML